MREFIDKSKQLKNNLTGDIVFKKTKNLFCLEQDGIILSKVNYNIELPDDFFDEEYVSIYEFETNENYKRMGYANRLLDEIFSFLKTNTNIRIITLIVDKINQPAINLYFKHGFKIFAEYDDSSYSLIKKI